MNQNNPINPRTPINPRRQFLKGAGLAAAGTLAAPAIVKAQTPIKWRFQTYAGAALGEFVTKPIIDAINKAAAGALEIELYYDDQIVPTGELFRALQNGVIDAVHSDDDTSRARARRRGRARGRRRAH